MCTCVLSLTCLWSPTPPPPGDPRADPSDRGQSHPQAPAPLARFVARRLRRGEHVGRQPQGACGAQGVTCSDGRFQPGRGVARCGTRGDVRRRSLAARPGNSSVASPVARERVPGARHFGHARGPPVVGCMAAFGKRPRRRAEWSGYMCILQAGGWVWSLSLFFCRFQPFICTWHPPLPFGTGVQSL